MVVEFTVKGRCCWTLTVSGEEIAEVKLVAGKAEATVRRYLNHAENECMESFMLDVEQVAKQPYGRRRLGLSRLDR
jgi:hypothetical protein